MNSRTSKNNCVPPAHRPIVQFGAALLVPCENGQYALHQGGREELTEAKEWASLFLHEAVLNFPAGRG